MLNKTLVYILVSMLTVVYSCNQSPYAQGKRLYDAYCLNCHMEDGSGLRGLIPPLSKADYLSQNPRNVACLIRNGIDGPITVNGKIYNQKMPGYPDLTEAQVTNIINYINNSWGNELGFTTLDSVFNWLDACKEY